MLSSPRRASCSLLTSDSSLGSLKTPDLSATPVPALPTKKAPKGPSALRTGRWLGCLRSHVPCTPHQTLEYLLILGTLPERQRRPTRTSEPFSSARERIGPHSQGVLNSSLQGRAPFSSGKRASHTRTGAGAWLADPSDALCAAQTPPPPKSSAKAPQAGQTGCEAHCTGVLEALCHRRAAAEGGGES